MEAKERSVSALFVNRFCMHFARLICSGEDFSDYHWPRDDEYGETYSDSLLQNKDKGRMYKHDLFKGSFTGDKRALAVKYVTSAKSRPALEAQYGKAFMLFIVVEAKQEIERRGKINSYGGGSLKGTLATKKFNKVDTANLTRDAYMKPCPNCKTPIEKSGGCKTLFCMWCNTPFCWKCLSRTECNCKFYENE